MAGTKEGAKKALATLKRRHGEDFFSRIGQDGGRKGRGHQFAHGKFSPVEAGKIGGAISKRGSKKNG